MQRVTTTLGRIYYLLSVDANPEMHEKYLVESLNYYTQSQSYIDTLSGILSKNEIIEMRACLCLNVGILYEEWKNLEEAEKRYRLCASLSQTCSSRDTEFKALANISNLKLCQNNLEEAENFVQEASRVAQKLKKREFISEANYMYAKIYLNQGKFESAAKLLKECYQNFNLIPDVSEKEFKNLSLLSLHGMHASRQLPTVKSCKIRALLLHKIGMILFSVKSYKFALKYFNDEIEAIKSMSVIETELLCPMRYIAKCYYHLSSYTDALFNYNHCISIIDDNDPLKAKLLHSMGTCKEKLDFSFDDVCSSYYAAFKIANQHDLNPLTYKIAKSLHNYCSSKSTKCHLRDVNDVIDEQIEVIDQESDFVPSDLDIMYEFDKLSESVKSQTQPNKVKKEVKFNPNRKNDLGETLLHVATIRGNVDRVVELIENGADVHLRDNCGWLPLHEACNHGHLEIVKILIDNGSFINDKGGVKCNGITPLIDAAENLHLDVVELLLDRGADPSIADNNGRTVLDVLRENFEQIDPENHEKLNYITKLIKSKYQPSSKSVSHKNSFESNITNSRLNALADDRIPLIIAAQTTKTVEKPKSENLPALISTPDERVVEQKLKKPKKSNKKRSKVIYSDEESIGNKNTPKCSKLTVYQSSPIINNNHSILLPETDNFTVKVTFKDTNSIKSYTIDCTINRTAEFLYETIVEESSLNETKIVLIAGVNIIFPFENIESVGLNARVIECYTIECISCSSTYTKLCSLLKVSPSKLHLTLFNNCNYRLSQYNVTSLSILSKIVFFTFILHKVDVFDISYSLITTESYLSFISNILSYCNNITILKLNNCCLTARTLSILFQTIADCDKFPFLILIDLSFNDFSTQPAIFADILYKFISKCPSLNSLSIAYSNLTDIFDPMYALSGLIQDHPNINKINFSGNVFDEQIFNNLFTSFLPWNDYECLKLKETGACHNFFQLLSNFFCLSNKKIKELDVSNNCSVNEICLLSNSPSFFHLEKLNLSNNNLDSDSVGFFRLDLNKFVNLKELLMYNNPDAFQSLQELSYFIHSCVNCESMEIVDLSNTLADSEAVDVSPPLFYSQSISSTNLKTIHLNQNKFTLQSLTNFIQDFNLPMFKPVVSELSCSLEFYLFS